MTQDARRLGKLALAVAVLGVAIGVGAGLLTLLLYGTEYVMLGRMENDSVTELFAVSPWRRLIAVTAGLSVAGVVWWLLRSRTAKVPSVNKAVGGERMPVWQTIVHVLTQIVIVGCGASIGREVAPRELGAMLGQRFADVVRLDAADRRMLVAVAAGAGLGGVYDAPLAGMFFTLEILLADITLEKAAVALGMSSVAAFVATAVKGRHVFYDVSAMQAVNTPSLMLFAVLFGAVFGCVGAWFRRGAQWVESHRAAGRTMLWMMPLAGLITGVIAIAVPQLVGNGRAAAQLGFSTLPAVQGQAISSGEAASQSTRSLIMSWTMLGGGSYPRLAVVVLVLAVTLAVKAAVTLFTIRSGASGGVLQPGIALGAISGALLGLLWTAVFPGDSVTACALIGAAAVLSASQQAPLMAMCLVMELTEAPIGLFVPVGMAVAVASLVSDRMLRRPGKTAASPSAPAGPISVHNK